LLRFAVLTIALWVGASVAPAQKVEDIRAAWRALQLHKPLEVGELLRVASDDYTGATSDRPADPIRAAKLAELAYQAADLGAAALAIRLATEAVDADPDCETARLALGYKKYEGRWLTPYGARMADRGHQWDAKYGWIDPADISRYDAGERRYRRRWIAAELDAQLHAAIEQGWQVRTDHFNVTTNHSLEAGVELAAKLEQLHQIWYQLFADFAMNDGDLRERFELHRVPGVRSRPFQVVYHRTQDEYNQALMRRQSRIAETIGIYFDHQREAHFFYSEDAATDATLYHESVHQLFQESDTARRDPGMSNNFWAIEGVACVFESLYRHETDSGEVLYSIGTPSAGRLPAARQRLLSDGYRVPLAELVTLGKSDLQGRSDLGPLYSQMAGLASYLMDEPQRHAAWVAYLRKIYLNQADMATLTTLTGQTYAEMEADYRAYLQRLPE
jgi:hypothetical protein